MDAQHVLAVKNPLPFPIVSVLNNHRALRKEDRARGWKPRCLPSCACWVGKIRSLRKRPSPFMEKKRKCFLHESAPILHRRNFDAYRWFGARIEQNAVVFRTFAPNASRITLTGAQRLTETDLIQISPGPASGQSSFRRPRRPVLQIPHLRPGRLCHRALRSLRLCNGTATCLLLDHHRPRGVPLHRRGVDG